VPDADFEALKRAPVETPALASGSVVRPEGRERPELNLSSISLLPSEDGYPIGRKEHGPDFLMDERHLWLRAPRQAAYLRVRSSLEYACCEFLHREGFHRFDAPRITPSACEGTTELFELDYFGAPAYLSQSGQLYSEAGIAALGKVYTLGPCFRVEASRTRRHLTEFWGVEPEMPWVGAEENMAFQERFIRAVLAKVAEERPEDLAFVGRDPADLVFDSRPFPILLYDEALAALARLGRTVAWGEDLGVEDEETLSLGFDRPFFIYKYPVPCRAFYIEPDPGRPELALSSDCLMHEGFGEIITGGQRASAWASRGCSGGSAGYAISARPRPSRGRRPLFYPLLSLGKTGPVPILFLGGTMPETSYTVLVVDDSRANREYLVAILEEDGYRITQASSGESCLLAAEADPPTLILLDVVMPGLDGFETLKRLRTSSFARRCAVIMLTSLDDQDSKLKAFDYGAVDYIVKSANAAEVRARVRVHVRLAVANEELVAARAESLRQLSEAQRSFLVSPQDLPEARFSIYYRSLHEAGGDFYDVARVSDGLFFYLMADVAGHDLATSYVTPAVKVLLKQCATPAYSVPESIAFMNGVLAKTLLEDSYLTAYALRINRRSGKAIFLAAGHPPAVFIPKDGSSRFASCENPCIGMIEDSIYRADSLDVVEGDRFILYTDGLLETSEDKRAWVESSGKLLLAIDRIRGLPLDELPFALVSALGADRPEDDVAVMAIEV